MAARILVVEDEAITAIGTRKMLEELGYEVAGTAFSGEEAVRIALECRPDLALMDIILNGEMDGIQAAGIIRERCGIPVVYVTACTDEATLQRAKVADAFGYIVKPFKERDLRIAVEIALYQHRADAERDTLIRELRRSLAEVRVLNGLLPICAWCKKVRDDEGYWQQIESYISSRSAATFTHGICPECRKSVGGGKTPCG